MISQEARAGVDLLFTRAARATLTGGRDDAIDIAPMPHGKPAPFTEKHMVVLTISSYVFRLLTIFHVNDDVATRNYFLRGNTQNDFFEIFTEIGNLCCGTMNRELGKHFPHLGMSTPDILENKSMPFLDALKPGYVSRHHMLLNNTVSLHATLCLCAYGAIDFTVSRVEMEDAAGALEMF
jgi:hypothetical protein